MKDHFPILLLKRLVPLSNTFFIITKKRARKQALFATLLNAMECFGVSVHDAVFRFAVGGIEVVRPLGVDFVGVTGEHSRGADDE